MVRKSQSFVGGILELTGLPDGLEMGGEVYTETKGDSEISGVRPAGGTLTWGGEQNGSPEAVTVLLDTEKGTLKTRSGP